MEEKTKIMENVEQGQIDIERYRKACQNRKVDIYVGVDTAAKGPLKALTPAWRTLA